MRIKVFLVVLIASRNLAKKYLVELNNDKYASDNDNILNKIYLNRTKNNSKNVEDIIKSSDDIVGNDYSGSHFGNPYNNHASYFNKDCQEPGTKGSDYLGTVSRTVSGLTCQSWASDYPHRKSTNYKKEYASYGDTNYCRNPSKSPRVWCYTTTSSRRWEFCPVPFCEAQSQKPRKLKLRSNLKYDSRCQCGVVKTFHTRIVGGTVAKKDSLPWMVALESEDGNYFCGGSIIATRHILTAAHCVEKGERLWVHIGDHDKTIDTEGRSKRIEGTATPHKKYNKDGWNFDVAMVKLDEAIDFGAFHGRVAPICLARRRHFEENADLVVAGWGKLGTYDDVSTVLKKTTVRTMSMKQCREETNYEKNQITDNMICAGAKDTDACQGDSGGPLIYMDPARKRWIQVGIVSWGEECAKAGSPGVYTNVARMQNWILRKSEKSTFCKEGQGY